MSTRYQGSMSRRGALPQQPGGSAGARLAGDFAGVAVAEQRLSPQERTALGEVFRRTMANGVHGLCFSPYLEGQSPGALVDEAQIRARLGIIRPYTRWVRTFSCTDGHERTRRIAHGLGMKTLVGAWLGTDRAINEREMCRS